MNTMQQESFEETVAMLRHIKSCRRAYGVVLVAGMAIVTIGVTAAAGKPERSPECAHLARIVAGREHTMLDGERFRATERQAYDICAADTPAFRKLIRVS
jgi:hypothetical protein